MRRFRFRRRSRSRQLEQLKYEAVDSLESDIRTESDTKDFDDYEEVSIEPFVPVSADSIDYDSYGTDEIETEPIDLALSTPRRRPRLPHLRRPAWNLQIKESVLVAIVLIVAGIGGTFLKQGQFNTQVEHWWPISVIIMAGLWMLFALFQRQIASFLGGAALGGVGLSLLMNTQDIARFEDTVLGVVLVAIGLGIAIRGFLFRQQTPV